MTNETGKPLDKPGYNTPRRPGQPGEEAQTRPGPSPDSAHPTGPQAPYTPESGASGDRIRQDAAGQYGEGARSPNEDGLSSANPVVLSGDGDATSGNGHGRDRDGSKTAQE
ncbi:hypothetical protein [Bosea sp. AAP35]|uniref:hypothetical protein n=1 Tax=Bosea sp. AAP35 TaxID=1523417 RepID=UPI0012E0FE67|nr:hypothetical protein [Bosea sp. AAP35]